MTTALFYYNLMHHSLRCTPKNMTTI